MFFRLLSLAVTVTFTCAGADQYAGPEACARCHKAISETQSKTAMAKTWRGDVNPAPPLHVDEGAFHYRSQEINSPSPISPPQFSH